jgi:alkylation response protein AidB-like acyl-CoA dehydrogenase
VDFALDESQRAIADLATQVLRAPGTDDARTTQALAGPAGYDEALWKSMAQAGLLALALPEDLGGDGCGAVAVCTVLREVGRQTLPVPALATLALGVLPTVALGTAAQRALLAGGGRRDPHRGAARDPRPFRRLGPRPGRRCGRRPVRGAGRTDPGAD